MNTSLPFGYTKGEMASLIVSGIIFIISIINSLFNLALFNIPTHTFAILAIFVASLVLWLFVSIDWPSLVTLIALGFLPEVTYAEVFTLSFGNTTFVFLLFTFIVTYALEQTNFLKRLTSQAINSQWAQTSPWRFVTAYLVVVLFIAWFVSPTILFMIVYPVYQQIMEQFGWKKGDRNASKLIVALYGTIAIGTAMTPINHVFAITAIGLYNTAFNASITNGLYMSFAVPAGLAIFAVLYVSLRWMWKLDLTKVSLKDVSLLRDIPKATKKEKWIVSVFVGVVVLWLLPEFLVGIAPGSAQFLNDAGIAFPPLVGAMLLAFIRINGKPLININEAISKGVFWPSLLIVAATLSLGTILARPEMGVIPLIEQSLTPIITQLAPILMVLVFILWAGIQTNFSSNLVTVSVVTTIAITIATTQTDFPVNTAVLSSLIGFMASLAYMTPPSMPYVAIAIGEGWTSAKDTFLYGGWLLIWSALSATFIGYPLGALILSNFV